MTLSSNNQGKLLLLSLLGEKHIKTHLVALDKIKSFVSKHDKKT